MNFNDVLLASLMNVFEVNLLKRYVLLPAIPRTPHLIYGDSTVVDSSEHLSPRIKQYIPDLNRVFS